MPSRTAVAAFVLSIPSLTAATVAQWPSTPSPNLPIGDANGDQAVPRIARSADGSCYLAWFDNRAGNYDVRLQRLDPSGAEVFPHGGIVVSSNPQNSSLVDWDLLADSDGGAVVTFTDVRAGGDLDVYAYRFDAQGNALWGPNGVALSNNGDFEANPRVCEASDGDFVFVWPNSVQRTIQLQRLDRFGVPRFAGDGIATLGDVGATPAFARLVAADNGAVIASWVRAQAQVGVKHVHAQKWDASGAPLWNGGTRLPVFDLASVPTAHEPRLVADGSGGALIGWHFSVGFGFSLRVQHVLANGAELFPHNGIDVSTSTNLRLDPALVWHAATSELVVAWNERNGGQSQWGIAAQKLDALGAPLWGPTGVTLLPIDTTFKLAPVAANLGGGHTAVAVLVESLGLLQKSVQVFRLDGSGAIAGGGPTLASTFASDKLRLALAATPSGTSMLCWGDNRAVGGADVYAAAVDLAGNIGVTLAQATPFGCGINPVGSLVAAPRPALGASTQLTLGNPLGTQAAGSLGVLIFGLDVFGNYPCGVPLPGFGMTGPGQNGEALVDIGPGQYVLALAGVLSTPTATVSFPYTAPFGAQLLGLSLYVQGLVVDLAPGAPVLFGLSNGVRLQLGS